MIELAAFMVICYLGWKFLNKFMPMVGYIIIKGLVEKDERVARNQEYRRKIISEAQMRRCAEKTIA